MRKNNTLSLIFYPSGGREGPALSQKEQSFLVRELCSFCGKRGIIIIAWIICYSAVTTEILAVKVQRFEKWFRYICAVLFLGFGIYLVIENLIEHC